MLSKSNPGRRINGDNLVNFPRTILASALLASTALPATAAATYVYVDTRGSDANSCLTIDMPCKTITRAALLAQPGWRIQVAAGTYCENIKITKSGTPGYGKIALLSLNGPKPIVNASCADPSKPALEITASNFYIIGNMTFTGSTGDGVYVHGVDSAHPATGNRIDQSVIFNNGGRNLVIGPYADHFILGYGRVWGAGGKDIMIDRSPYWDIHDMNIYQAGPSLAPATGTYVTLSPNGNYEGNDGKENLVNPNLDLEKSPFTNVENNAPGVANGGKCAGTFTYIVNPPSDFATDTFANNDCTP